MDEIFPMKLKENEINTDRITLNDKTNSNKTNKHNNFISNKILSHSEHIKFQPINLIISDNENYNEVYKFYTNKKKNIRKEITEKERIKFLLERFKNNQSLKCNILIRSDNFYVYSNTEHFIFSAHKIKKKLYLNYLISSDYEGKNKIAQINSSLFKNEYIMYDDGISPKEINNENNASNNNLRRYLLQVKFKNEHNLQRGYIYLPETNYEINIFYNKDKDKNDKLSNLQNGVILYKTEVPEFDLVKRKYVNKFSSRIKESSIKNFRLVETKDKINKVILECGKVKDNYFIMDFTSPLSPLEAFGISLSYLI